MTKMLDLAVERARKLSEEQQDEIAAVILGEIEDEVRWNRLVGEERAQAWLAKKAERLRKDIEAGKAQAFDPESMPE